MSDVNTKRAIERVVGKTIVKIELNPFHVNDPASSSQGRARQVSYDPHIFLSDGSVLTFRVDETEIGEYGVRIHKHRGRR